MAPLLEEILQPISTPAPDLGPPGVIRDLAPSIMDNVLGNTHTLKLLGLVDLTNCSVECYCGRSSVHATKLIKRTSSKNSFYEPIKICTLFLF